MHFPKKETNMATGLKPGDTVIALASAAMTAAIVSGAVSGGIAGWILKHKTLVSISTLLVGAVVGWMIGAIVGKIMFPSSSGNIMVAKWGPGSLPLTLKGNIVAGVITALTICTLMALLAKVPFIKIALPSVGVSLILSIVLALMASLF
jgi:hypothetical protein